LKDLERVRGRSEGDRFTLCVCRVACRNALTIPVPARVWRPTKNAQRCDNHLRYSLGAPLTILESPRLEATLDEHLLPFGHKPFSDFRQLAPGNAADPFDPLDISVLLVTEGLVDGEREIRNRLTRRCGSYLRILPSIPEENYLVHSDA
jgi:hypothetical protein